METECEWTEKRGGWKLYYNRVFFVAAFIFLLNMFFAIHLDRVFSAGQPAKKKRSRRMLSAAGLVMLLFTVVKPVLMFLNLFFIVYYFVLFSKRLSSVWKFIISVTLFQIVIFNSIPYVFPLFSTPEEKIVGLHFFNFFYSLPLMYLGMLTGIGDAALARVAGEFVSSQALFGLKYASGTMLLANMGFSYGAIRYASRYAAGAQSLDVGKFRLSWPLAPLSAVAAVFFYSLPEGNKLYPYAAVLWPAMAALYTAKGLVLADVLLLRLRYGTVAAFILFFAAVLLGPVFFMFFGIGMLDSMAGIGNIFHLPAEREERVAPRISNGGMKAAWMVLLLGIILSGTALTYVTGTKSIRHGVFMPIAHLPAPDTKFDFQSLGDRVRIKWSGGAFTIDKYEYPNAPGKMPVGNVWRESARALCAEQGKRLCRPDEWALACRAGSFNYTYYLTTDDEKDKLSNKECGMARGAKYGVSGFWKKCVNPYGIHDMMGNMWELVDLPDESGFIGIMGQGSSSNQGAFNECTWISIIYENQSEVVPKSNIGFRCCSGDIYTSWDSK
jgi:hypothetical protein